MTQQPPPVTEPIIDENGRSTLPWVLFFNQQYDGDAGNEWTPTFQNLTEVGGSPTFSARIFRLSKYLTFFRVTITPATNTSATAGTTYIDNFPEQFSADGVVFAVSGNLGATPGHIVSSNNRIYVPGWTTVTVPLTLIGIAEAS